MAPKTLALVVLSVREHRAGTYVYNDTSMVGAGGYVAIGFHHFLALPPLIIGAVAGAWLGVRLRDHTPDAPLQAGFAILRVIVASQLIVDATNIY